MGSADEGSKTFVRKREANDEIGLVPLVVSISQVLKGLKAAGKGQPAEVAVSPEAALADLVAGGGLCSWYIATCQVTPPSDDVGAPAAADDSVTRAMLQQAFDMRAMLVILDLGDAAASDPGWSLSRFVQNELLHSGNRLLAIGRPEDVSQGVLEALRCTDVTHVYSCAAEAAGVLITAHRDAELPFASLEEGVRQHMLSLYSHKLAKERGVFALAVQFLAFHAPKYVAENLLAQALCSLLHSHVASPFWLPAALLTQALPGAGAGLRAVAASG